MDAIKASRFRGINNRLPPDRLNPLGDREAGVFVPDASNVDLTDAGSFQSRPGYERIGAWEDCRGLFGAGDHAYFASGTDLCYLDQDGNAQTIGSVPSAFSPLAFAHTSLGVVMSDGQALRLLRDRAVTAVVPPAPNPVPSVAVISGGLAAGRYGIMFTSSDARGVRSAFTFPLDLPVPEGGGLSIINTTPLTLDVFVTAPDGAVFYAQDQIQPGAMSLLTVRTDTEPIVYQALYNLPPGEVLGYHKGRLLSAVGALVHYSLPYSLGLYHPARDYIALAEPVAILASVDEGLWIATTKTTYFLPGGDLRGELQQKAPFGAVRGTLSRLPNSQDLMWFSERGPVRVSGGAMTLLQDENIAFSPAESGASVVREQNGLRTFISALSGAAPAGGAVAGSFMDAEVIK